MERKGDKRGEGKCADRKRKKRVIKMAKEKEEKLEIEKKEIWKAAGREKEQMRMTKREKSESA